MDAPDTLRLPISLSRLVQMPIAEPILKRSGVRGWQIYDAS